MYNLNSDVTLNEQWVYFFQVDVFLSKSLAANLYLLQVNALDIYILLKYFVKNRFEFFQIMIIIKKVKCTSLCSMFITFHAVSCSARENDI